MTLTLINSQGLATSNSYSSYATSLILVSENIKITATYAALSTTTAEACLIFGTTLTDMAIDWAGGKATSTQALDWPRINMSDSNDYALSSTTIPLFLQRAVSFYAYYLSQENRIAENATKGFKKLKAGSLFMEIDKYDRIATMPSIVWDFIKPFGTRQISGSRVLERR